MTDTVLVERRGAAAFGALGTPFHAGVKRLRTMEKPVLACVHGAVAGGGLSLMLACDLAIAASDAKFSLAYAGIGTSPDGGSSFALPRIVGLRKALELALLGERIDAELEAFSRCAQTADFAQGVGAFVAKRKPGFTGR